MTLNDTTTPATDDHSGPTAPLSAESNQARAERLLYRLADLGEVVMDNLDDPLDIPDYLLTVMAQAGTALVQLAVLEAQQQVAPQWPDLVTLGDSGQWLHVVNDEYGFQGLDDPPTCTLDELRRSGPTREYRLLPHSPLTAPEGDPS